MLYSFHDIFLIIISYGILEISIYFILLCKCIYYFIYILIYIMHCYNKNYKFLNIKSFSNFFYFLCVPAGRAIITRGLLRTVPSYSLFPPFDKVKYFTNKPLN